MPELYKLKEQYSIFEGSDYIAVLTDRIDCGKYSGGRFISASINEESDFDKMLELRVFNEDAEYRAWRDNLGETSFKERIASDDKYSGDGFGTPFDELQYLDMDDGKTHIEEGRLFSVTTGGGSYALFGKETTGKVLVRTYIKKGIHGLEYACDWRVVGYRDADFTLPGKEH